MNDIVPIGNEHAKAIQELAKLGSKALDVPIGFAGYLAKILGTLPEDLIGVLGGDKLRVTRAQNLLKSWQRMAELHKKRGVTDTIDVSPNIALPLLEGAANESQSELQEIWARLMAAATDPARAKSVRASFIAIVKQMDPMDALVLTAYEANITHSPNGRQSISSALKVPEGEIEVSFDNLVRLGVYAVGPGRDARSPFDTATGRLLKQVLRD